MVVALCVTSGTLHNIIPFQSVSPVGANTSIWSVFIKTPLHPDSFVLPPSSGAGTSLRRFPARHPATHPLRLALSAQRSSIRCLHVYLRLKRACLYRFPSPIRQHPLSQRPPHCALTSASTHLAYAPSKILARYQARRWQCYRWSIPLPSYDSLRKGPTCVRRRRPSSHYHAVARAGLRASLASYSARSIVSPSVAHLVDAP